MIPQEFFVEGLLDDQIVLLEYTLALYKECPKRWIQMSFAEDDKYKPVSIYDNEELGFTTFSTKWCLSGAFYLIKKRLMLGRIVAGWNVIQYNDDPNTTYEGLINMLEHALKELKEKKKLV